MLNLNKQTQYFINGIIMLVIGISSVTILPVLFQKLRLVSVDNFIWVEIEFFTMSASVLFYLFSPKYYKAQLLSIICAISYYIIFASNYSLIFLK
ncbi:hypothetical protein IJ670_00265 [bacterium]|nr:hypothetical protein [bacterium]